MMNKYRYLLINFFLIGCFSISAQEVLLPLSSNPVLEKQASKAQSKKSFKVLAINDSLPFFDDFSYSDSIVVPNSQLWTDRNVYINSNYSNNAISIGMATFDALDQYGRLYKGGIDSAVFLADILTSKAIDLKSYGTESGIFMSFFYQAGGIGEMPEKTDTFLLQFYKPTQKKWTTVWKTSNNSKIVEPFKFQMIHISDTSFIQSGFRFRFLNYSSANLNNTPLGKASNGDIWNLDYIYINSSRNEEDTVVYDLAITRPPSSVLKYYESIPWRHFINPDVYQAEMTGKLTLYVKNNYKIDNINAIRKYEIKDVLQNFDYEPFVASQTEVFDEDILTDILQDPLMSDEDAYKAIFKITAILDANYDQHPENDTASYYQVFDNYYAYDDGSAEFGYGLEGEATASAQVAYKFITYRDDSLQQVSIFFNRTYNNENRITFHLMVLDDNKGMPGKVLYDKIEYFDSRYIPDTSQIGYNKFYNYRLDTAIKVPKIFYVGWQQTDEVFMNVGFDKNRVAGFNFADSVYEKRIFYNLQGISSSWQNSQVVGALMMRPVLGPIGNTVNTSVKQPKTGELKVYPNPVSDRLYINLPSNAVSELHSVQFYDITGKIMLNKPLENGYIDVSGLRPGLYLIKVSSSTGKIYVGKVIKNLR